MPDTQTDNLVRAFVAPEAATLRDAGEGATGRTLFGHFSVFNRWTEIDSAWEGQFLERIAPGAFAEAFAEHRDQIKVLYDHGHDPQLGNKPLGQIVDLREDKVGAYYEVELIRASYNDDFVIPAAQAGLLGASFRFKVAAEEWNEPKRATTANPKALPERTITNVKPLYEFGPVTFPAYPDGTNPGVRSLTDSYVDRVLHDPLFAARFAARAGLPAVERLFASATPPATAAVDGDGAEVSPPPTERQEPTQEADAPPVVDTYLPTVKPRLSADVLAAQREQVRARMVAAVSSRKDRK